MDTMYSKQMQSIILSAEHDNKNVSKEKKLKPVCFSGDPVFDSHMEEIFQFKKDYDDKIVLQVYKIT